MSSSTPLRDVAALAAAGAAAVWWLRRRHATAPAPAPKAGDRKNAVAKAAHKMDPNLPIDVLGRVYHLQVTCDEIAERILSVGDAGRAERIAALFDAGAERTKVVSSRGFITHTGYYKGVRMSVVATGMGVAMIDFLVREARAILDGPMVVLRYGTSGGLRTTPAGAVAVATEGAVAIHRDPDMVAAGLHGAKSSDAKPAAAGAPGAPLIAPTPELPYSVSQLVKPHPALAAAYAANLEKHVSGGLGADVAPVVRGVDAQADTFYASQGRTSTKFSADRNTGLLEVLEATVPNVVSLEMETYTLLELAASATASDGGKDHPIAACGAHMVVWNRHTKKSIDHADLVTLEVLGGRAALETLAAFPIESLVSST